MSDVTPLRTGRLPFRVTLRWGARAGVPTGSGEVYYARVPDAREWTRSRAEVLRLAAFAAGLSSEEADRATRVALVVWANESGWGANEWRWNAWGAHCFGRYDCQRLTPETLAAFRDLGEAAAAWWTRALRDPSVARLFRAGDVLGAVRLMTATERGAAYASAAALSEAEARRIDALVGEYLTAGGVVVTDVSPRRSRGGGSLLWLAIVAAAVAAVAKGARR